MPELIGKDVYLRVTDTNTGAATVTHHRAWDADRLIESQRQAHRKEGEKDGTPLRFIVTMASSEDYRNSRRKA